MSYKIDWGKVCEGLWENAKDFIFHALEHLREFGESSKDYRKHHLKWAILSVHQAAECFCNILFIQSNPGHQEFIKKGKLRFPSLRKSLELIANSANVRLSSGEKLLLHLLKELPEIRDELMHRPLPDDLDRAVAISLLGLLRVVRKRLGETASEFKYDYPRVEADVFSIIPSRRLEEYYGFAEQLLQEEYPDKFLGYCEYCGTNSIVANYCEICFEEMDSFECPYCGEEDFVPSRDSNGGREPQRTCSWCGKKYPT